MVVRGKSVRIDGEALERIRREEGERNPADIADLTTLEDLEAQEERLGRLNFFNKEQIEPELNPAQEKLLRVIRKFTETISEEFRREFLALIEERRKEGKAIPTRIIATLENRGFLYPEFMVANGVAAKKIFEEVGFKDKSIDPDVSLSLFSCRSLWLSGGGKAESESPGTDQETISKTQRSNGAIFIVN